MNVFKSINELALVASVTIDDVASQAKRTLIKTALETGDVMTYKAIPYWKSYCEKCGRNWRHY